jgi:hypothetical protein
MRGPGPKWLEKNGRVEGWRCGFAVSAFAALGDVFRPQSFAGLFGAAPSIALATLAIRVFSNGSDYVATAGRSMVFGAVVLGL